MFTVHYLDHSAWLVQTPNRLLLFDYGTMPFRPAGGSLANGVLNLAELPDLPLYVFASHRHADHYSPDLQRQVAKRRDARFILGMDMQPSSSETAACPPGTWLVWPHSQLRLDDLVLRFSGSTDSGVSILIESPERLIYHGGDLALWDDTAFFHETYRREIDTLAGWIEAIGRNPDLAFLPVSTSDGYQEDALLQGLWYALSRFAPRFVLPMHAHGFENFYLRFADMAKARGWNNILAPQKPGDSFAIEME